MPGTSWTEMTVDPAGWMDSIPIPLPRVMGGTSTTEYVIIGGIIMPLETVIFVEVPPGSETWTEMSVAATASTEVTVSATSWTELSG